MKDYEDLPSTRKEAKEIRSRYYFTGKPCIHGHISKRFTDNSTCHECHVPRQRKASLNYHHANKHKPEYRAKQLKKQRSYRSKPQGRIADGLRTPLRQALKSNQKTGSAIEDLGCSIDELIIHLESLWQEGMNWNNYGFYGWHIDHKIPLNSFDLTDREQFLKACHYTNLQPLWMEDNLSKQDKI